MVYWLERAHQQQAEPAQVIDHALHAVGVTNAAKPELTKAALLRNEIVDRLGCFDTEGLKEMRRGKSPTVRRGPYKGQELSVDHIIPRAVVPVLDNVIANLELLPLRLNESKNARITQRQRDWAEKFLLAS